MPSSVGTDLLPVVGLLVPMLGWGQRCALAIQLMHQIQHVAGRAAEPVQPMHGQHDRPCPLQHTEVISDRNCDTLKFFMIEMQHTELNCDNPLKLFVTERVKKVREINDRH